jgi:hypothetical protein
MSEYAKRDHMMLDRQGGHYSRHVSAMTAEGLHAKSDIAGELAFRDWKIAALLDRLDAAEKELTTLWEAIGLASTIKSDMEIDTSDPLGMMQQVARHADELERENERLRDLLARTLGGHRDLDLQDAIIAALDAARGEK